MMLFHKNLDLYLLIIALFNTTFHHIYKLLIVIRESDVSSTTEIDSRLQALQQELLRRATSKKEYDEVADETLARRMIQKTPSSKTTLMWNSKTM